MEKLKFADALQIIRKHNEKENIISQYQDEKPLYLVIVYDESNFKTNYNEKQRSYKVRSDEKYFLPQMCGNSLYGNCLDGVDIGVRLDYYDWKIAFCYFMEK